MNGDNNIDREIRLRDIASIVYKSNLPSNEIVSTFITSVKQKIAYANCMPPETSLTMFSIHKCLPLS